MTTVSCARCGKQAECEEDGVPLGWSIETLSRSKLGGRVLRYCTECLRENIRNIEAKLPEEWWG